MNESLPEANRRVLDEHGERLRHVEGRLGSIDDNITAIRRENADQHEQVGSKLAGLTGAIERVGEKLNLMDHHREKAKVEQREERRLAKDEAVAERAAFRTEIVEIVKEESVIQADKRLIEMRERFFAWIRRNPIPTFIGGGAGGAVIVASIIEFFSTK